MAIVGPPTRDGADVDYLFAQVAVDRRLVDTGPNCGNMLSAVGPFAIEKGLVAAEADETRVRIHNTNTGKIIEALVSTPGGALRYQGDAAIDGVPGTAAPVYLAFREASGAKTGKLLPSGSPQEVIAGVPVSLIDGATPVVIARAETFGLTGPRPRRHWTRIATSWRGWKRSGWKRGVGWAWAMSATRCCPSRC